MTPEQWTLLGLSAVVVLLALRLWRGGRPALGRPQRLDLSAERIVPPAPETPAGDREAMAVWGFDDTAFAINEGGHVTLTGSRYELSGKELPNLLPWVRKTMELPLPVDDQNPPSYPPQIPDPLPAEALLGALGGVLQADQISQDAEVRLRHGHGHTQEEMFAIKYGTIERVPDVVVYPASDDDVAAIVRCGIEHDACLIPYGGGTNVTDALRCPTNEARAIVSVDMSRMNRILWIDPVNKMARIQAGAVGRLLMKQLAEHGLMMGHEPDSVEFSTLGGWVATHASGMKKNRYGNIEDLVLDVDLVTADGVLSRQQIAPRESIGTDPRRAVLGSEGNLGIITSATVRLFPLPELQRYGSIIFRDYTSGVHFLYELQQTGTPPASIRLVDNMQFQFGQALKPAKKGWWAKTKSKLTKWLVVSVKGYDPDQMVACTVVFEGERHEVEAQEKATYALAKRYGGMAGGSENGRAGYNLTFAIAYIRDFVLNHWILAESFETSVPWTQAIELCERVKQRVRDEHASRGLPGKPFVTCRLTQVYPTGCCIYFYFAYYYKGVENPTHVYHELENAARDEILLAGGSLSHHHGVGKIRTSFLPRVMSPAALRWRETTKRALDPTNVFGTRNAGVVPPEPTAGPGEGEPA